MNSLKQELQTNSHEKSYSIFSKFKFILNTKYLFFLLLVVINNCFHRFPLSTVLFCVELNLSSHSSIFHSYGDVTIVCEGLQILTYARHSSPLSSEGSFMCYNNCDTVQPFIMVIAEDPWHHTCCRAFDSEAVTTCFYDSDMSRLVIEPRYPACEANALPLRRRGSLN